MCYEQRLANGTAGPEAQSRGLSGMSRAAIGMLLQRGASWGCTVGELQAQVGGRLTQFAPLRYGLYRGRDACLRLTARPGCPQGPGVHGKMMPGSADVVLGSFDSWPQLNLRALAGAAWE